jgi:hypothetical protein
MADVYLVLAVAFALPFPTGMPGLCDSQSILPEPKARPIVGRLIYSNQLLRAAYP